MKARDELREPTGCADADTEQEPAFDYLRVSVTDRCQLSCAYCRRPEETLSQSVPLPLSHLMDCCAAICASAPIRKIRLSGGEPLLRSDLPELVSRLANLHTRPEVTLTTNGVLLAERASELAAAGLSRLNVSLDSADAAAYTTLTRFAALARVLRGLAAARAAGFRGTKINTVLTQSLGTREIEGLLSVAADHEAMLRFIELMPIGLGPGFYGVNYLSADEGLRRIAGATQSLISVTSTMHPRFAATLADGREVLVEMIAPMSRPFCSDCRRIRLSCDGTLIPCLLSPMRLPLMDAGGRLPNTAAFRALLRQCADLKRRAGDLSLQRMWAIGG
jgi:cyclic pyranopterin phosphate synthase